MPDADEAVQRPWAEFWADLDGDGDGRVSLPEFQAFLRRHGDLAAVVLQDDPSAATLALARAEAATAAQERDAARAELEAAGAEAATAKEQAMEASAAAATEAQTVREMNAKLKAKLKDVLQELQAARAGLQAADMVAVKATILHMKRGLTQRSEVRCVFGFSRFYLMTLRRSRKVRGSVCTTYSRAASLHPQHNIQEANIGRQD